MKLGEALSVRARQAQKMNDLRARIKANAKQQGDQKPPEDADKLLKELLELSGEHTKLVLRINKANAFTAIEGQHKVLLDLLMEREDLNRQRAAIEMTANAASQDDYPRYMRSELPMIPAVKSVSDLRAKAEAIIQRVAKLDAEIQTVNWSTDI